MSIACKDVISNVLRNIGWMPLILLYCTKSIKGILASDHLCNRNSRSELGTGLIVGYTVPKKRLIKKV